MKKTFYSNKLLLVDAAASPHTNSSSFKKSTGGINNNTAIFRYIGSLNIYPEYAHTIWRTIKTS